MNITDFSDFMPTGNKALDMVSAATGHAKHYYRRIDRIVLNRAMYGLFKAGAEVLAKRPFDDDAELTFDGVRVEQGSSGMFDSMKVIYHNGVAATA